MKLVFFDFILLIYKYKKIMRPKIKNKKSTMSITIDSELYEIIQDKFSNKSKFVQNCLIEELCKNNEMKEELKKFKIVL